MSDHSGGLALGRVLLDRSVSGHQTWSGRYRLPLPKIEILFPGCLA